MPVYESEEEAWRAFNGLPARTIGASAPVRRPVEWRRVGGVALYLLADFLVKAFAFFVWLWFSHRG